MSLMITTSGRTIERLARPKSARLTPKQLRNRRNEDWRRAHDDGLPDAVTGRITKRSVRLIAQLAGVPERTVRHGIAQARLVREAIAAYDDF